MGLSFFFDFVDADERDDSTVYVFLLGDVGADAGSNNRPCCLAVPL